MRSLGLPMIVSLNMYDLASRDGLEIDIAKLEARLGVPVVTSRATRKSGRENLLARIDTELALEKSPGKPTEPNLDLKNPPTGRPRHCPRCDHQRASDEPGDPRD